MPKLIPVIATSLATGEQFTYPSMTAAARDGGFERSCIHDCLRGYRPSHAGFKFKVKKGAAIEVRATRNQYERIADAMNAGLSRREVASQLNIKQKTITSKMATIRRLGLLNPGVAV